MHDWEEFYGMTLLWLAFMAVTVGWTVRIASLLYHQRRAERYYRHELALSVGAAVREAGRTPGPGAVA